jgi:hypothetical protein
MNAITGTRTQSISINPNLFEGGSIQWRIASWESLFRGPEYDLLRSPLGCAFDNSRLAINSGLAIDWVATTSISGKWASSLCARRFVPTLRVVILTVLAALAIAAGTLVPASLVSAQDDPPERRCAALMACESWEINHAYTVQYESGCGANCSVSYWVRDPDDGRVLVSVTGVRSATVAVRGLNRESHPDVRIIAPRYGPTDAHCCPAVIVDTRYVWDAGPAALVIADERVIPTGQADFEALHDELRDQGYTTYSDGP